MLHLVQALAQANLTPRLWLVTRGAQPVGAPAPLQVGQAPLWGMGRVMALEYPEVRPVCLDLAHQLERGEAQSILGEIWSPDSEQQIAYRRGIRHVARVVRPQTKRLSPPATPFKVTLEHGGILDHLYFAPIRPEPRQGKPWTPLAPGEVEIEVRATALNFRDVLKTLGMLEAPDESRLAFGYECAGVIVNVGEHVERSYGLQVGDEVIAFAKPSLASMVNVRAEFVVAKPKTMTFEEAATIPVTFLTAYYGLHQLAMIQPGDKVLIHAAAGGVGQAAVQLCQRVGAEIFATASPGKWAYLRSQGVTNIYNSRTLRSEAHALSFAEGIMADTDGGGVDIVINSLTDDFITKSFEVLAQGGRFIELGRRRIWSEQEVQQKRPDVRYFPFDLGEVGDDNPAIILSMFESLMPMFAEGSLRPLPRQLFSMQNLVSAFQYMQEARQIGKVVISLPSLSSRSNDFRSSGRQKTTEVVTTIRPDSSYLITGGLGALGLKVAQWLIQEGACYLVLASRRGAEREEAQDAVRQLEQAGANVLVVRADVAHQTDVSRLIEESQAFAPLRGVIHAAGVLADGVLVRQSWDRFLEVMAPKVQGSWNLHLATQDLPLDFFICFSSIASLLGSSAQANYAAANAFMDALAHHRRALGLPGLSINWGAWAESGMATDLSSRHQRRLVELGLESMEAAQALQMMGQLMGQGAPQVAAANVNWSKWLQQFSEFPPVLENFRSQQSETPEPVPHGIIEQLEATPINLRRTRLMEHVQAAVGQVLGIGSSRPLLPTQGFFDYGMDSLTSIELRNVLQSSLGCSLSQTLAFTYPTTETLVDYLANDVLALEFTDHASESQEEENTLEAQINELLAEDVEALLLKELEELDF